ncbi:hypothetical protein V0U79_12545 [Hyphobacterium sp. HN65]|uniref:Winged helix domain-containing protein n=1 Tax=Hyphobacterium lacteum TaxID=3116575 RepID=A0ABU7LTG4_9PROT|nr:hypothetical protein [Hyphobacterium sp. HN65]MEE2527198.1 hypothetical protein [Hyphobacterium sp. HN65]
MMRKRRYPRVLFRRPGRNGGMQQANGREGETLLLLVARGAKGITALDFTGGPAYRLSAYIKNLRDMDLDIETVREPHDCGWHGRYILHSWLDVESIDRGVENVSP